jgi:hypothetical protein
MSSENAAVGMANSAAVAAARMKRRISSSFVRIAWLETSERRDCSSYFWIVKTAKQVELGASARETGFGKKVEPANVCAPFAGSNPNQHRRR